MAWRLKAASCCSLALWSAAAAADFYCCQDPASGRRTCGDNLPEICRGRSHKVLDAAGNTLREVGPPPTAEQKTQAQAEAQRRQDEAAALREQRRRNQALLATYSSVQDIDDARSRSEAEVFASIRAVEAQIATLRQRRKKLENETEFYRKKTLPPEVAKGLQDADFAIQAQTDLLAAKNKELEAVRARYDEDKRRYLELLGKGTDARPLAGR